MATVIIGGGIIGLSTAYYLSKQQPERPVHIIDSAPSLLLSASGYAGGFLAKDWFSSNVGSLGELSFRLHQKLADENNGHHSWGYSASTAYSLSIDETGVGGKVTGKKAKGKDWLLEGTSRANIASEDDGHLTNLVVADSGLATADEDLLNQDGTPRWIREQEGGTLEQISSEDGCAQVEPRELCEWLISQCEDNGIKIHLASHATSMVKGEAGKVTGLSVKSENGEEQILTCFNIVLTAGAWTPNVFQTLFPHSKTKLRIGSLAGYSLVVRSPRYSRPILDPSQHRKDNSPGMCHSVFCATSPNWSYAPEAISRMTQSGRPEIYVAGLNVPDLNLPQNASSVKALMDAKKMKDLRETTVLLAGLSKEADDIVEDDLEVVRGGLCFRPVSNNGQPIVTKLTKSQIGSNFEFEDSSGVYVAAGHGPWGISLSLGTGLVIAEMIQDIKTSADVSRLGTR